MENINDDFIVEVACRKKMFMKAAFAGPSGSGKTLSALMMAAGMIIGDRDLDSLSEQDWKDVWRKVCFVDTENRSALYYVGLETHTRTKNGPRIIKIHPFLHIPFQPPYDPRRYEQAIWKAQKQKGVEVVIIDSISHEWDGEGGCLQLVDKIGSSSKGGNFNAWSTVTPLHTQFIEAIKNVPCHVIATMRSKQEYAMENENGRNKVKKMGMKSVQREGTDYELGIIFDVNMDHTVTAGKDRTGIFAEVPPFIFNVPAGQRIAKWCNDGEEITLPHPQEPVPEPQPAQQQPLPENVKPLKKNVITDEQKPTPPPATQRPQKHSVMSPQTRAELIKAVNMVLNSKDIDLGGLNQPIMYGLISQAKFDDASAIKLTKQLNEGDLSFFLPDRIPAPQPEEVTASEEQQETPPPELEETPF